MIERVKTGVLIFLIGASVFLTWQLWTFQPEYDYMTSTEEVVHDTLAEEQELRDLVLPSYIIYHEEQRQTMSYPGDRTYSFIQAQMEDWSFEDFRPVSTERYREQVEFMSEWNGLHIYFPTELPVQVLTEVMDMDAGLGDVSSVNRMWLFEDAYTERISALFMSEAEQVMVQAQSNIDDEQFEEYLTMARTHTHTEVDMFYFAEEEEEGLFAVHYLPVEPQEIKEYRYFYNEIPLNLMISHLFVDPTLVRRVEDQEGVFYTDGTRGLQNDSQQKTMHFFHPQEDAAEIDDDKTNSVKRGTHFVNQHKGWETSYMLDEVEESLVDQQQKVQYRQLLQDEEVYHPIYSESDEQDRHVIRLQMQSDLVVGYYRPLYQADSIMDEFEGTLPSGEELIDYLQEREIDLQQIESMKIGYKTEMTADYVHFIPHWVIRMQNRANQFVQYADLRGGS